MKLRIRLLMFFCLVSLPACAKENTEMLRIITATGKAYKFHVELAATPEQKAQGLMGREKLARDEGMLFTFTGEKLRGFWMKNVPIPLDMIFIKHDGTIAHIHHRAKPNDETVISSELPVNGALEIAGGLAQKLGISEGDKVEFRLFETKY
ncbi:MAG: DUF192 domain-containing protein [Alphaproteobacteria bacterium]|nr:DUF192 domain-containing protein [Alphaproteobacteria bacterium]